MLIIQLVVTANANIINELMIKFLSTIRGLILLLPHL